MQHSPFQKPTGSQWVTKLLAILWHLKVSMFTRAQHLNLSSAKLSQTVWPKPVSLTSVLMLFFHLYLGLPSSLFPSGFVTKPDMHFTSPHVCHMPHPFNLPGSDHYNEVWWGVSTEAPHYAFLSSFLLLPPSQAQITTIVPYSQTNWLSSSTTCTE